MVSRRLERERARTKRNDLLVVAVSVIFIVAILGGYFVYDNYLKPEGSDENGGEPNPNPNPNPNGNLYKVPDFTLSDQANSVIVLEVKDYGAIVIEVYRTKQVPLTVDNFLEYVHRGFYDGLIFHRVIDDFMIQGGGFYPDLTEKERPPEKGPIPLEIDPSLKHVDGAIAMARMGDPNSATNQFFIDDGPQPSLEPGGVDQYGYAVFGQVVAGMEHVRAISGVAFQTEKTPTGADFENVPLKDVIINKMYEYYG
ncbi:MAG: peptidylprolyl isomerase [Thermoplasmata archaeon]|nr:peptidylprolyl isomerase [Thermoplasmata archaeon]